MSSIDWQEKIDTPLNNSSQNSEFIDFVDSLDPESNDLIKSFYDTIKDDNKKIQFELRLLDNRKIIDNIWIEHVKKIIINHAQEIEKQEAKVEVQRAEEKETKKEIEKQEAKVEVQEAKVEVQRAEEEKQKLIEAKQRVDKLYSLFWWREWLDQRLSEKWVDVVAEKKKAEKRVLKDNPKMDVNSEEFKSRVEISFIASNKKALAAAIPEDKKKEFETLYRDIQDSAHSLGIKYSGNIDYNDKVDFGIFGKDTILMDDRRKVAVSIPDGTNITRKWWVVSYEKDWRTYEINLDEKPPERFIETDGIKVKVDSRNVSEWSPYELVAKKRQLEKEIKWIKGYLEEREKSGIEQTKLNIESRERDYNYQLENCKKGIYLEKNLKDGNFKPVQLPDEMAKEVVEKLLQEEDKKISNDRFVVKSYEEQKELLRLKEQELVDITLKEQNLMPDYRRSIREKEEIARSNLDFLGKSHMNIFWQDNINRVIGLFNKHRALNENAGARPVDINEWFRDSDKLIIIDSISKLLGWVKYFKWPNETIDYIDGQKVDNKFIVEKLKQTWVLQKDWVTVNLYKIEELLKSAGTKQDANRGNKVKPEHGQNQTW